jgi:hypothetical protein
MSYNEGTAPKWLSPKCVIVAIRWFTNDAGTCSQ